MKFIFAIIIHLLIDWLAGINILILFKSSISGRVRHGIAILLGMFADSLFLTIFHFLGFSLALGFLSFSGLVLATSIYTYFQKKPVFKFQAPKSFPGLSIWEWIFFLLIIEKIVFNIWQLINMPLYFDDAMTHWSGKARALYGNENWSFDPSQTSFLGKDFGYIEYPLFANYWRATNASLVGNWNDLIARFDSLIFFLLSLWLIYAIIQALSESKWLGLAGAFVYSAMPLQIWHNTAGYFDIAVQVYVLLAVYFFIRKEWIFMGLACAALCWSKNEGLIIYLPAFLIALIFYLKKDSQETSQIFKNAIQFLAFALIPVVPWQIYKIIYGIGLSTPTREGIAFHSEAPKMFLQAMFYNPTSSIFWIIVVITIILGRKMIIKTTSISSLLLLTCLTLSIMFMVFSFTGAFVFLENQTTIHRSLLQISPVAIILVCTVLYNYSRNIKMN